VGRLVSTGSCITASRRHGPSICPSWIVTSEPESGSGQFGRGPTRTSTDWKNSSRSTHSEAILRRDSVCRDEWRSHSGYGPAGVGRLGHSYNNLSIQTHW